jgi:phosphate starvation-inducible PhoH-like protein
VQQVSQVKKKFHIRELTRILPKTENQRLAIEAYTSGVNVGMMGCAGTGKTFLALYMALQSVLAAEQKNIVVVRSAVSVRDQGFLPGDQEEKNAWYELPYKNMCDQFFPYKNCYDNLKASGYLYFYTTTYLRGLTFDDCVIIVDECQSLNAHELDTVLTRVGENCRIILCGDGIQTDLRSEKERRGFHDILPILREVTSFFTINFTVEDIVRSGFVRDYIACRERIGLQC